MNKDFEEEQEYYEVKGNAREKKLNKKRNTMRVNSRGLKDVILPLIVKKGKPDKKTDFSRVRVTNRGAKLFSFDY